MSTDRPKRPKPFVYHSDSDPVVDATEAIAYMDWSDKARRKLVKLCRSIVEDFEAEIVEGEESND